MRRSAGTLAFGLLLSVALPAGAALASDSGDQAINPDQPDATPAASPANSTPAAQTPVPKLVAASADSSDLAPAKHSGSAFAASADSTDLAPAKPIVPVSVAPSAASGRVVAGARLTQAAQNTQVASLPQPKVTDGDLPLPTGGSAGSNDLGITAKAVQVAQVELEPPPPIPGYQPLGTLKPYSATDTLEMDIDRDLARLESSSNPTLVAGLGFRTHSGTEGTSFLNEFGAPFEASFSPWYTGMARINVVPVYLDAGTPANGNLGRFGANPLTYPVGLGAVSAGDQNASGVGITGSYTWTDFYAQFGTTPLGFPVTNLIGDIAYTPKFFDGNMSVRFEALRQPVTDSVLSYAGTHANFSLANTVAPGALGSNTLWGGVVKTGGHITAFYDNQSVGAYAGAGWAALTGTNVADNSAVDAILGTYFRPFKTDNWALRVGVSLYYTGYDKNLDGFTFGQGGYFSPQDFEGLGFPIELTGHYGPWTYLASTTLGVQHYNQNSSPTFPNRPTAQAALEAASPSFAFLPGIHTTGFGFNLKGQAEYAIDPTTSLGAAGSLYNGNGYTVGIVQLYLRKTFDWFAPVAIKNDAESIAARDMPMSHL